MHEASIVISLLEMAKEEMAKHGATKLTRITVRFGALANLVPESMQFAFEAMTKENGLEGAELVLDEVPVRVKCCNCSIEFTPEDLVNTLYLPCPQCGEEFGHEVIQGKELYLESLEAE